MLIDKKLWRKVDLICVHLNMALCQYCLQKNPHEKMHLLKGTHFFCAPLVNCRQQNAVAHIGADGKIRVPVLSQTTTTTRPGFCPVLDNPI